MATTCDYKEMGAVAQEVLKRRSTFRGEDRRNLEEELLEELVPTLVCQLLTGKRQSTFFDSRNGSVEEEQHFGEVLCPNPEHSATRN